MVKEKTDGETLPVFFLYRKLRKSMPWIISSEKRKSEEGRGCNPHFFVTRISTIPFLQKNLGKIRTYRIILEKIDHIYTDRNP